MDIIGWLNKLELGDGLLTYVGEHYFKHLLLVKLMNGSDVDISNIKKCECYTTATELRVTLKLKKSVNFKDVQDTIEDSLNGFAYSITVTAKSIQVTISNTSGGGEMYNGNVSNSYA